MAAGTAVSGLSKFGRSGRRLQSADISAVFTWGVAATAGALWLIQPFDWLKEQFTKKPESAGS